MVANADAPPLLPDPGAGESPVTGEPKLFLDISLLKDLASALLAAASASLASFSELFLTVGALFSLAFTAPPLREGSGATRQGGSQAPLPGCRVWGEWRREGAPLLAPPSLLPP